MKLTKPDSKTAETVLLNFRCDVTVAEELARECERVDITLSEALRQIVGAHVATLRKGKKS